MRKGLRSYIKLPGEAEVTGPRRVVLKVCCPQICSICTIRDVLERQMPYLLNAILQKQTLWGWDPEVCFNKFARCFPHRLTSANYI